MLLAHPEQWQRLQEEPQKIPGAVEEVLRASPSIVAWRRKALREAAVGGVTIPEGGQLLLVMGSANRDEAVFENGEEFDIDRPNSREHLAFGYGIHYCLGNMLAKLQTRITVEETLRIAPHLRLSDPDAITFGENLSFRAPVAVPVTWES